jgi:hypothetical protein
MSTKNERNVKKVLIKKNKNGKFRKETYHFQI